MEHNTPNGDKKENSGRGWKKAFIILLIIYIVSLVIFLYHLYICQCCVWGSGNDAEESYIEETQDKGTETVVTKQSEQKEETNVMTSNVAAEKDTASKKKKGYEEEEEIKETQTTTISKTSKTTQSDKKAKKAEAVKPKKEEPKVAKKKKNDGEEEIEEEEVEEVKTTKKTVNATDNIYNEDSYWTIVLYSHKDRSKADASLNDFVDKLPDPYNKKLFVISVKKNGKTVWGVCLDTFNKKDKKAEVLMKSLLQRQLSKPSETFLYFVK